MDFNTLYLLVLKFLNFRPRSEKEVRDYLTKKIKKFSQTDFSAIDLIIHKLTQQKFLDDEEFARWLVRSRTEFKPKGKYLVKQELKQKGISQDIIEKVLGSEIRTQSDKDLATQVLEHKKKKYASMEQRERFQKASSMLARRGFDVDAIREAIDAVFRKMV